MSPGSPKQEKWTDKSISHITSVTSNTPAPAWATIPVECDRNNSGPGCVSLQASSLRFASYFLADFEQGPGPLWASVSSTETWSWTRSVLLNLGVKYTDIPFLEQKFQYNQSLRRYLWTNCNSYPQICMSSIFRIEDRLLKHLPIVNYSCFYNC